MVYFCADDYGVSEYSNNRIEYCLKNGLLNKVSVLPNGEITDFKQRLSGEGVTLSLHLNLIEGFSMSAPKEVPLLVTVSGQFRYSFIKLFLLSLSPLKRQQLEKQIYSELQKQIKFWVASMGKDTPIFIDSHQHTHMIPLVFKVLMKVIEDEKVNVEYIRIPSEPVLPYIFTPSLYFSYSIKGFLKQWVLKVLSLINTSRLKKSNIQYSYFMGAMFSGRLNEKKIKKLLPRYLKLADKHKRHVEIGFHPGYLQNAETLIDGVRDGFKKFYFSPWRKTEFDTLINLTLKDNNERRI